MSPVFYWEACKKASPISSGILPRAETLILAIAPPRNLGSPREAYQISLPHGGHLAHEPARFQLPTRRYRGV